MTLEARLLLCKAIDHGCAFDSEMSPYSLSGRRRANHLYRLTARAPEGPLLLLRTPNFFELVSAVQLIERLRKEGTAAEKRSIRAKLRRQREQPREATYRPEHRLKERVARTAARILGNGAAA